MASKLSIKITGIPEFERKTAEVIQALNSEGMQDRLLPAAQLIRDLAKRFVNLGSGRDTKGEARVHLRDAIFAVKGKRAKGFSASFAKLIAEEGPSVIVGVDRKRLNHAHLVEFGHGGPNPAPAHPFMRPALAAAKFAVVQIVKAAVTQALARFSKS